jgi:hypothetical protein
MARERGRWGRGRRLQLPEREEKLSEKNEPTGGLHLSEGEKERGYRFGLD